MLKVELHTHTADDPVDAIPHSTFELIDRAAALGYDALAITLEAERDPDAICEAIAAGRVRVESRPLAWSVAARVMSALLFGLEQPAERQRVRAVA